MNENCLLLATKERERMSNICVKIETQLRVWKEEKIR